MFRTNAELFDSAAAVTPLALKNYAQALGFLPGRTGLYGGTIDVFERSDGTRSQVLVPTTTDLDDYSECVLRAAERLAAAEGTGTVPVLRHLALPPADVLRFRDASDAAKGGRASITAAAELHLAIRQMLLSQAHRAITPQKVHKRLSVVEAERYVESCIVTPAVQMSFAVEVACPLGIQVHEDRNSNLTSESFGRQVTVGFTESLQALAEAAASGSEPVFKKSLSANFCDAVQKLQPLVARRSFEVRVVWSKAKPLPTSRRPFSAISITPESLDLAAVWSARLRARPQPVADEFLAWVSELRGEPDDTGRMAGATSFQVALPDRDPLEAMGCLGADDYAMALRAHGNRIPVLFKAVLIERARTHRLNDVSEFRLVDMSTSK